MNTLCTFRGYCAFPRRSRGWLIKGQTIYARRPIRASGDVLGAQCGADTRDAFYKMSFIFCICSVFFLYLKDSHKYRLYFVCHLLRNSARPSLSLYIYIDISYNWAANAYKMLVEGQLRRGLHQTDMGCVCCVCSVSIRASRQSSQSLENQSERTN